MFIEPMFKSGFKPVILCCFTFMLFCTGPATARATNEEPTTKAAGEPPFVWAENFSLGDNFPDFDAIGNDNRLTSVYSHMGEKGLFVVFFRSADW